MCVCASGDESEQRAPAADGSTRRRFLRRVGRASAALALSGVGVGALAGCAASLPRVAGRRDGRSVRVPASVLEVGSGVLVTHPDDPMPIYLHRHAPDRHTAVLLRCTHQGCEVDPVPGRLVCPCHGSEFSTDGALLGGPADRPLLAYPVTVDGTELAIDLAPVESDR